MSKLSKATAKASAKASPKTAESSVVPFSPKFNIGSFDKSFDEILDSITKAEQFTKPVLRDLSRSILEAWHMTGKIVYANKLLKVLSPANKKAFVMYFTRYSGYSYDKLLGEFTGKSKKRYESALNDCRQWLANPLNNIWVYVDRHLKMSDKEFKIDAFAKYIKQSVNKAQAKGFTEAQLLAVVFQSGIHATVVADAMAMLVPVQSDNVGEVTKAPAKAKAKDAPLTGQPLTDAIKEAMKDIQ